MTEAENGVRMKCRVGKWGRDRDSVSGSRALGRDVKKSQRQEPWVPGGGPGNQVGLRGWRLTLRPQRRC